MNICWCSAALTVIIQWSKLSSALDFTSSYPKLGRDCPTMNILSLIIFTIVMLHSYQIEPQGSILPGTRWPGSGPNSVIEKPWLGSKTVDLPSTVSPPLSLPFSLYTCACMHVSFVCSPTCSTAPPLELYQSFNLYPSALCFSHIQIVTYKCRPLLVPPIYANFLPFLITTTHI